MGLKIHEKELLINMPLCFLLLKLKTLFLPDEHSKSKALFLTRESWLRHK